MQHATIILFLSLKDLNNNKMDSTRNSLPQLVFGNSCAFEDTNVRSMNDRIQSTAGFKISYGIAEKSTKFLHRSSKVRINGLSIVSTASTPLKVQVDSAEQLALPSEPLQSDPLQTACVSWQTPLSLGKFRRKLTLRVATFSGGRSVSVTDSLALMSFSGLLFPKHTRRHAHLSLENFCKGAFGFITYGV